MRLHDDPGVIAGNVWACLSVPRVGDCVDGVAPPTQEVSCVIVMLEWHWCHHVHFGCSHSCAVLVGMFGWSVLIFIENGHGEQVGVVLGVSWALLSCLASQDIGVHQVKTSSSSCHTPVADGRGWISCTTWIVIMWFRYHWCSSTHCTTLRKLELQFDLKCHFYWLISIS